MAVRLNVIMVSSAPQTATAQRVAEAVVGELIGLAGIDLALVDRLDQIQPTSTDFLTLDSLAGDVAVLNWQAAEATVGILNRLGFAGSRARHAHDPEATSPGPSRRIYAYDLNKFDDARRVIAALGELLASRQVRTFSLDGSLAQKPAQPVAEPIQKPAQTVAEPTPPRAADRSGDEKSPDRHILADPASTPAMPHTSSAATDHGGPKKTLDLDELVDQLDSLDLE